MYEIHKKQKRFGNLVSLESQAEHLRLQDKLGNQNFHLDMNEKIESVTKASKETTEVVKQTGEAIKLEGDDTTKALHELENATKSTEYIIKNACHFDNRLLPALFETFCSKNNSQF